MPTRPPAKKLENIVFCYYYYSRNNHNQFSILANFFFVVVGNSVVVNFAVLLRYYYDLFLFQQYYWIIVCVMAIKTSFFRSSKAQKVARFCSLFCQALILKIKFFSNILGIDKSSLKGFSNPKKRGKSRTKKPKWAAPLFSATSRKNPWTWQGTSFFPNWFLQLNSGWFLATVAGSVLLLKILSTMYYPSAEQRKRKATKGDKKGNLVP